MNSYSTVFYFFAIHKLPNLTNTSLKMVNTFVYYKDELAEAT